MINIYHKLSLNQDRLERLEFADPAPLPELLDVTKTLHTMQDSKYTLFLVLYSFPLLVSDWKNPRMSVELNGCAIYNNVYTHQTPIQLYLF